MIFPSPAGMSLTKLSLAVIPGLGKWHLASGRENNNLFYSVEGWILDQQADAAKKDNIKKNVGLLQDIQSKFKSLQLHQQEAKL